MFCAHLWELLLLEVILIWSKKPGKRHWWVIDELKMIIVNRSKYLANTYTIYLIISVVISEHFLIGNYFSDFNGNKYFF